MPGVTVSRLCRRLGMTRQNYYARRKKRQRRTVEGALVAGLVQRERRLQPRLGTRKLHHMLQSELQQAGVRIGRDRMFEELRKRDLLLKALPAPYPHTTQSYHNLPVFRNVIKDRPLQAPNEVWVSDLSYLRTVEGFLYMALITDKFSRKIVGWHVGDSLEAVGCVRALEHALVPTGIDGLPLAPARELDLDVRRRAVDDRPHQPAGAHLGEQLRIAHPSRGLRLRRRRQQGRCEQPDQESPAQARHLRAAMRA